MKHARIHTASTKCTHAIHTSVIFQGGSSSKTKEVGSGMLIEHSARAPRLEMVSFKKLNKGTLALGVVFKVS